MSKSATIPNPDQNGGLVNEMLKCLNNTQIIRAEYLAHQGIPLETVLRNALWQKVSVKPKQMKTLSDVVQDLYQWYCSMEEQPYNGPLSEKTEEFRALLDFAKADGYSVYKGRVFKLNEATSDMCEAV